MKHEFPIAKVREDGTPAIWFTHDHWLLLESGIVRAYLNNREHLGHEQARREYRIQRADWPKNSRVKEWEFMDCWPQSKSQAEAALRLFNIGFKAHGKSGEGIKHRWTPEKVQAHGDVAQQRAYAEEKKLIQEAEPKEETKP